MWVVLNLKPKGDLKMDWKIYKKSCNMFAEKPDIIVFITQNIKEQICKRFGHKLVNDSSVGPESGNDNHYCNRCGEYWRVQLY
jgi:hypothetical protein